MTTIKEVLKALKELGFTLLRNPGVYEEQHQTGFPKGPKKMRSIVCRVRKKYFDAILRGDKEVEWRKDSEFWRVRLDKYVRIPDPGLILVLLCGKRVHRRKVRIIYKLPTPKWFSEQGKKDVPTPLAYAIHMGDEIK